MFKDKNLTQAPSGSGKEQDRSSSSRGAGHVSSGRVGKTPLTTAASDRKREALKLKLAARGILYDPNYSSKNKGTQKEENLVAKVENPPAVAGAEKKIITTVPERKCEESEIEKIKEALIDALEPLEDGCYPQFYNSQNAKGVLSVTCANEQTELWLERIVPQLKPWQDAKLCVKPKADTGACKVLLKTPKLFAKTDPKKVLQMLSTQNKTLETSTWTNISAKSEASGQTLVYAVDNESLEAVRALNNKVYLGLGNVELTILNNNEEGGKGTSGDTGVKNAKGDKQTSVGTGVQNEGEAAKQTSEDTNEKKAKETDEQT